MRWQAIQTRIRVERERAPTAPGAGAEALRVAGTYSIYSDHSADLATTLYAFDPVYLNCTILNMDPLSNIYNAYEWLTQRVNTALVAEVTNRPRLADVEVLCTRFRTSINQVSFSRAYIQHRICIPTVYPPSTLLSSHRKTF